MRIVLLPFLFIAAMIFSFVVYIRNICYEYSIFKIFKIPINSFCVGNITVGGTGKTPMIDYLIQILSSKCKIAVLSRGYGRKTKGFLEINKSYNAKKVGDEPLLLYRKNSTKAHFYVCEDRVKGYNEIIKSKEIDCILLDDAFQHKSIKAKKNIILINYHQPSHKDYFLPLGRLREHRKGLKKADCIVVTKCPEGIKKEGKKLIYNELSPYLTKETPVFYSTISYGRAINILNKEPEKNEKNAVIITGIAFSSPFLEYIKKKYNIKAHLEFDDHQEFDDKALKKINKTIEKYTSEEDKPIIITTEKDFARLLNHIKNNVFKDINIYYTPIYINMGNEKAKFEDFILKNISLDKNI